MTTHKVQPVKVATFGMDQRAENVLGVAFKHRGKGRCEIAAAESANVVIFDMDGAGAEQAWQEFRARNPDLPTIIVSADPVFADRMNAEERTVFVKKPILMEWLLEAIGEATQLSGASVPKPSTRQESVPSLAGEQAGGTAAAATALSRRHEGQGFRSIKVKGASSAGEHYYRPAEFVQGYLLQALGQATAEQKVARLTWGPGRSIVIDPVRSELVCDMAHSKLRQSAIIPVSKEPAGIPLRVEFHPAEKLGGLLDECGSGVQTRTVESFVWQLTVLTANGRAPEGTPLDEPMYLQSWPNFSRLADIPNALRITALWVQQPRSLRDLSETLDVPIEDVLSLYSAASAIGLAGVAGREADTLLAAAEVKENKKRGLFGAIMQRLKGKTSQAQPKLAVGALDE